MWDVIYGELGSKAATGVARKRAITMLPPKIMEKKMERIAQKNAAV
jgi:hypothetical protein